MRRAGKCAARESCAHRINMLCRLSLRAGFGARRGSTPLLVEAGSSGDRLAAGYLQRCRLPSWTFPSSNSTLPLVLLESKRSLSHMLPSHGARFPSAGHARSIAHIPARKCRAVMMHRSLSRDSTAAAQQCLASFSTHSSATVSRLNLHSSSRLSALCTFRNQRRSFWFGSGAKKEGTGTNVHLHLCKFI